MWFDCVSVIVCVFVCFLCGLKLGGSEVFFVL